MRVPGLLIPIVATSPLVLLKRRQRDRAMVEAGSPLAEVRFPEVEYTWQTLADGLALDRLEMTHLGDDRYVRRPHDPSDPEITEVGFAQIVSEHDHRQRLARLRAVIDEKQRRLKLLDVVLAQTVVVAPTTGRVIFAAVEGGAVLQGHPIAYLDATDSD